jgi:nucleoside-diphosphate-sugar epimerase
LYGEPFNFSYGIRVEVIDIVRRIIEIAASPLKPVATNNVQAEIRHMHLSSDKAQRLLDWKPRIGFDEGLTRTVAWYQSYFRERHSAPEARA